MPDTFWGFREALKFIKKKSVMPPLGLLTVMSLLPQERFEAQRVIDLNVEPLTDKQIQSSDLIFTSTMVVQEDSHNEVIDKAHFYGKQVVAGGPFPTSYPERNQTADFIVAGEAEVTLPGFLEDLVSGNPRRVYTERDVHPRVQLTKGGKVLLSQTPLPRWDLVDLANYTSAAIQYSRGCPFDCEFCDITALYGRESRTKTPEQIIAELDAVYKTGFRGSTFIVDDNFIGNRKELKKLLPEVIKWQKERGYPFSFYTEGSINLAWPENRSILEEMAQAGFDQVFIGIESDNPTVLDKMGKKQNTKMPIRESIRVIQEAGLEVTAGFIVGADGSSTSEFSDLFNLIQESGIVVPMPGLLTAIKGTRLYKRLEAEGRLRSDFSGNNTHQLGFNFTPEGDEKEIISGYKTLLEQLFNPRNYYQRCRVLRDRLGKNYTSTRGADFEGARILARSLSKQLFAPGGLEYAKYLLDTAFKRPSYFPDAVTHAVKLHHFESITDAMLTADEYNPRTETLFNKFKAKVGRLQHQYAHDLERQRALALKYGSQIVRKAERRYNQLHVDFRKGAEKSLYNLRENIQNTLSRFGYTTSQT